MNIDIKDTRLVFQLSEISYGECFEVASSATNYADKFVDRYLQLSVVGFLCITYTCINKF